MKVTTVKQTCIGETNSGNMGDASQTECSDNLWELNYLY